MTTEVNSHPEYFQVCRDTENIILYSDNKISYTTKFLNFFYDNDYIRGHYHDIDFQYNKSSFSLESSKLKLNLIKSIGHTDIYHLFMNDVNYTIIYELDPNDIFTSFRVQVFEEEYTVFDSLENINHPCFSFSKTFIIHYNDIDIYLNKLSFIFKDKCSSLKITSSGKIVYRSENDHTVIVNNGNITVDKEELKFNGNH